MASIAFCVCSYERYDPPPRGGEAGGEEEERAADMLIVNSPFRGRLGKGLKQSDQETRLGREKNRHKRSIERERATKKGGFRECGVCVDDEVCGPFSLSFMCPLCGISRT